MASLTITTIICFICYYTLNATEIFSKKVSNPITATLMIGVLALVIVSYFVSLYVDTAESLYLSFLTEMDVDGDNVAQSKNCPREIRESLIKTGELQP